MPTLLTISGALRQESTNRKLLAQAAVSFGDAEVIEADLNLPLYDGDLEAAEGIPASVQKLADQIKAADAIVVSSPEYNSGIPGVLKNALDWVSRVEGRPLADKPTAVIMAAAGRSGGATAQYMVLHCLLAVGVQIVSGPPVLVAASYEAFDETGKLVSERYQEALDARMAALRAASVS